jgi:predicted nucleic acid-binding protein
MILADTSVWIHHFRQGEPKLARYLVNGMVLMHPFVAGELACGNLKHRASTLSNLLTLPAAVRANDLEVLRLIEDRRLWARGLGWTDIHLLASALLSKCGFWTLDKRLAKAAHDLGLQPPTPHSS